MELDFQYNEIIILSGPSSTGKSYFAKSHFTPSQICSSDEFRLAISDEPFQAQAPRSTRENDGDPNRARTTSAKRFQAMSQDAFWLLHQTVAIRAKHGQLTVIDATSLYLEDIESYVKIAQTQHIPVSVVVFNTPLETALKYDATRQFPRGEKKLKQQFRAMKQLLKRKRDMNQLGVRNIYVVTDAAHTSLHIQPNRLYVNLASGLDVMGDGHGLLASRIALIKQAGYVQGEDGLYRHPDGRKLVYLNDETSRGSEPVDAKNVEYGQYPSIAMINMMKKHVESGLAYAVDSNHNYKIWRWLEGRKVSMKHGDEVFVKEMEAFEQEYGADKTAVVKKEWAQFLKSLPSHLVIEDDGHVRAVVVHAGIHDDMMGKEDETVRDFCRFGPTDGLLENGKPNRLDWTQNHHNGVLVIWGHVPHPEAQVVGNTINIDQGGYCGHYLTMLRYPEMDIVQEKVAQSFVPDEDNPILQYYQNRFDVPLIQKYNEGFEVATRWKKLRAHPDYVKSAIETVSTHSARIEEMFYIPPTMSPPPKTSTLEDYLEHPQEAFDYFESLGVKRLIVEKKHMGSRAVLALFRTEQIGKRYINRATLGTILTRTNAKFFNDEDEQRIVHKLVADFAPYFAEMNTDVLLLDAEILPWNLKAAHLIENQYGLVADAALYTREKHLQSLSEFKEKHQSDRAPNAGAGLDDSGRDGVQRQQDLQDGPQGVQGSLGVPKGPQGPQGRQIDVEIAAAEQKLDNARRFQRAFTYFCWNLDKPDAIQIAPFHILGFDSTSHFDKTHEWHMQQAQRLAALSDLVIDTPYRVVEMSDEKAKADIIDWWAETTSEGHEGFVFKPLNFIATSAHRDGNKADELIQPAIKVRGREYLRIIYGMDYLEPENLEKLKKRSTKKKMRNALNEFMLSIESVERFLKLDRVDRIHECVLAAMAYESEPMDPRL
ncbi:AAA family ATPase [Alicyclobacillus sp. SO9]|uniref:AAA family ATPase n=1 Tax=Alicyclobacillus sp. SO9 TaxID=2665646 RepID=UPI0018E75157|nr:AAA family ATPase [Alicyclobacillus sp. SO9]QQE78709.1 AAA family ATPase [Alicyclobacillus sp. SO9]